VPAPGLGECDRATVRRLDPQTLPGGENRPYGKLPGRGFAAIAEGETVSPAEVDEAIDARQRAEARLAEWSP
jgi:hypothetical protein